MRLDIVIATALVACACVVRGANGERTISLPYRVERYANMTNVPPRNFGWPDPPPYNDTVKRVEGRFNTAEECVSACVAYEAPPSVSPVSGWSKCQSYTWLQKDLSCTLVVDANEWKPVDVPRGEVSECGRIKWAPQSCSSDADCSYNGICLRTTSLCECSAEWTGDRCQTLKLAPALSRDAGLRARDEDRNTSTWGGSVLLDDDGETLHMWAAEMLNHCGIDSWTTNSHIIHAVCRKSNGTKRDACTRFERIGEVWPAFSHEPNVVRAPTGEWIMYFTASQNISGPQPPVCTACSNGRTSASCNGSAAGSGPTYMTWSHSPFGPWRTPQRLFFDQKEKIDMDTNLAVVVLSNGSVVGIGRTGGPPTGIVARLVSAEHWRDPSSYRMRVDEMLFPDTHIMNYAGVEDPFLWIDANGVFHAVFHNQIQNDDERLCGGHAFSVDGTRNWTFTGTAWSNTVHFEDGTSYAFSRRERPHLIFADKSDPFRITGLSTGVQYGSGSPIARAGEDACFTLVQPVL